MTKADLIYNYFVEHRLLSTDSRKIEPRCIFFALKGDNFNGNLFALEALKKGAALAIIDEDINAEDDRLILVKDALQSLQELSTRFRDRFQIPVIAITGSNGKTTTKELIATVLSSKYKIHFTQGNLNNHIGVPLTLLQLTAQHELAIIEMGANHQQEIAQLCKIAKPTHGLITNIGKAHLEGFGGIEGVKKGKGELFDYLIKQKGIVFANQSESSLTELLEKVELRSVIFSNNSKTQGFLDLLSISNNNPLCLEFEFHNNRRLNLKTQLQGKYNLPNVIYAICIGLYFRIDISQIISQIERYVPTNNRSQLIEIDSNYFILDAYNANPSSMKLAVENFSKIDHQSKIAILGDMYELGSHTKEEHQSIATFALAANFKRVIFVGKHFPNPDFKNVDELREWFRKQDFNNTYFLVKGSRGLALEKLLKDYY